MWAHLFHFGQFTKSNTLNARVITFRSRQMSSFDGHIRRVTLKTFKCTFWVHISIGRLSVHSAHLPTNGHSKRNFHLRHFGRPAKFSDEEKMLQFTSRFVDSVERETWTICTYRIIVSAFFASILPRCNQSQNQQIKCEHWCFEVRAKKWLIKVLILVQELKWSERINYGNSHSEREKNHLR